MIYNKKKTIKKNNSNNVEYASFHARAIAAVIDCAIIAIAFMPLFYLTNKIIFGNVLPVDVINAVSQDLVLQANNGHNLSYQELIEFIKNNEELNDYFIANHGLLKSLINQLIQVLLIAAIFLYFWIKKQATLGKICLSIKIVDAETLGKPTTKQLVSRMLGYIVSTVPLLLGFIWISFDPRKQGWHDKIAGTVVIKNKSTKK